MKALKAQKNTVHWLLVLLIPVILVAFYASMAKIYLANASASPESGSGPALAESGSIK